MLFHHPQLSHQQTFAMRDGECMPAAGSTACAHPTACAPLPGWPEGQGPQLQPLPGRPRHPGPATPGTCGQCITSSPFALFQFIQEADWHTQVTTSSYCRAHHNSVFTQMMALMLHALRGFHDTGCCVVHLHVCTPNSQPNLCRPLMPC